MSSRVCWPYVVLGLSIGKVMSEYASLGVLGWIGSVPSLQEKFMTVILLAA